jgi:hypothetical protein
VDFPLFFYRSDFSAARSHYPANVLKGWGVFVATTHEPVQEIPWDIRVLGKVTQRQIVCLDETTNVLTNLNHLLNVINYSHFIHAFKLITQTMKRKWTTHDSRRPSTVFRRSLGLLARHKVFQLIQVVFEAAMSVAKLAI